MQANRCEDERVSGSQEPPELPTTYGASFAVPQPCGLSQPQRVCYTVISPVLQMRTLRHSKSAAQLGLESKQSNTRGHTLDYSVSDREIQTDRDLGTRWQTDETHIGTERWKQETGT